MNTRAILLHRIRTKSATWMSTNWSGYAISGKTGMYTAVSAQWRVPRIQADNGNTYSSAWIGIDGFTNESLIQVGTESDFVNGSRQYYAWWEILPKYEQRIPFPVGPGDLMAAEIRKLNRGRWRIQLTNRTKKWVFQTIQIYHGPQSSVEFIQEAPIVGGRQSRLAMYGQVTFDECRINGINPRFNGSNAGVMIQRGVPVSTPSRPTRDGDGFTIGYGANPPKPQILVHIKPNRRNTGSHIHGHAPFPPSRIFQRKSAK